MIYNRSMLLSLLANKVLPEASILKLLNAETDKPEKTDTETDNKVKFDHTSPNKKTVVDIPVSPAPLNNMQFWAITALESLAQDSKNKQDENDHLISLDNTFFEGGSPFTQPAEVLWRDGQIPAKLLDVSRKKTPGNRIDTTKLVKKLSRAEFPQRLPRANIKSNCCDIWIILDYRADSIYFRQDINHIQSSIYRTLGKPDKNYKLIAVDSTTRGGYFLPMRENGWVSLHNCPRESKVLLISALAVEQRSQWDDFIALAAQRKTEIVWLNPIEPKQDYETVKSIHFSERLISGKSFELTALSASDFLLACISMSWDTCPGLLRALRHLLSLTKAPINIEVMIWQADEVLSEVDSLKIKPEYLTQYRNLFIKLTGDIQTSAIQLIEHWHKDWPSELILWEQALWQSCGLGYDNADKQWLAIAKYMQTENQGNSQINHTDSTLVGWVMGAAHRHPPEFWQTDVGESMSQSVRLAANCIPNAELPEGLLPLPAENETDQSVLNLFSNHKGVQVTSNDKGKASPLFQFKTDKLYRALNTRLIRLANETSINVEESVVIQSSSQKLSVLKTKKPDWAIAIEQNPTGLYCTLPDGCRLRWCYPNEVVNNIIFPLGVAKGTVKATWVDEKQWLYLQSIKTPYLPDNAVINIDEYGIRAEISIRDTSFGLRWIPPQSFWMGSPENEPERIDDETRHRVMITKGYWLAETTCTQQLWQAVMGNKPSHFKGDGLPVEQVSWQDVQTFCQKLKKQLQGFQVRLPTEAEWEHACRAGTESIFWWGDELSTEQANFNGGYPNNNAEKEIDRDKTLPVKSFKANPWGLFQVHGNVWEWCEDWYGSYNDEMLSIDPVNGEPGAYRVVRGGCWILGGRYLRAAYRRHFSPDNRNLTLGFRLAAGRSPGEAEK